MLNKTAYKILSVLHKNPFMEELKLREPFVKTVGEAAQFMKAFDYLGTNKYILRGSSETGAVYDLTPLGEGEYLQQKRNNVEFRLTQAFALLGVFLSIIALIKS